MLRASVIVAVIVGWSTPALAAPASQPASQPTSQPASQPASQPVSKKKPASKGDVERPDPRVDSIFGGSQDTPDTKPKAKSKSKSRDDAIFGGSDSGAGTGAGTGTGTEKRLLQRVLDQGNKLQIGGLLYLRLNMSFTDGDKLEDHPISMPNLAVCAVCLVCAVLLVLLRIAERAGLARRCGNGDRN